MKESKWMVALKGLVVGGTMIIPGVSGGTMAMILGIYDQLISSVSSWRQNPKKNTITLFLFALGGGLGIFLFSSPISWLLEYYELPVLYFFMGAVFGGIPMIEEKSGIKKFSFKVVCYMVVGVGFVLLISAIPSNIFGINGSMLGLFLVGVTAAVALILPGISVSHLFLILGMYENIINAIKTLNIWILMPLAVGVLLGIVLFCKVLEMLLRKYPEQTYLIILGFILGSVAGIFPGFPEGTLTIVCAGLVVLGFCIVYHLAEMR